MREREERRRREWEERGERYERGWEERDRGERKRVREER